MIINHGLMTGQVLQRNQQGKGGASLRGRCDVSGFVEVRAVKGRKVLRGLGWQVVGRSEDGRFGATLAGLPTGGPYRIDLRVRQGRKPVAQLSVEDVFVGDVWILGGQSNMEGVGCLAYSPKAHRMVRAFYMRDEWGIAEEPIHVLAEAVDRVHNGYGNGPDRPSPQAIEKLRANMIKGMSPGHVFGLEMYRRTQIPQGLIACAHGGTSMEQWSPGLRNQGGDSLYGAMMRRYETLGQDVAGVLWYQGESDANRECARVYTERMIELVAASRRDMDLPRLPWMVVQLGCHASREDDWAWDNIQEQQRLLPEAIKYLDVAPAIDLELDDGIHIGGRGQQILGRRLARIADRLVHKAKGVRASIALDRVNLIRTPDVGQGDASSSVELTYKNVSGSLVCGGGRPAGFVLLNQAGEDVRALFKTTIRGCRVLLHTNMPRELLETLSVSYGHGRYPFCNVTDKDGMSLPAMQALPVNPDHAPFLTSWQTAFLPNVLSIARAGYARVHEATGWREAPPRAGFGVLPKPANSDRLGVYAMRTTLTALEALDALLLFGANGPFKLWLNGKLLQTDPDCTMPIQLGQYSMPIRLNKGQNHLLVAYAIPVQGAHFGIAVRVGTPEGNADSRISVR